MLACLKFIRKFCKFRFQISPIWYVKQYSIPLLPFSKNDISMNKKILFGFFNTLCFIYFIFIKEFPTAL